MIENPRAQTGGLALVFLSAGLYFSGFALAAHTADAAHPTWNHLWAFTFLKPILPVYIVLAVLSFSTGGLLVLRPGIYKYFPSETLLSGVVPASNRLYWPGILPLLPLAWIGLYLFRQRLFLAPPEGLGDSLLLLEHIPVYSHLFGYLDSFDELLELYLHSRLYLWLHSQFGLGPVDAYVMISCSAYLPWLLAFFYFVRPRDWPDRIGAAALLIPVPALQLYAGYVENYSLAGMYLALLLFPAMRWLTRKYRPEAISAGASSASAPLSDRAQLIYLAMIAAIGVLHHLMVSLVLPGLIYYTWIKSKRDLHAMLRMGRLPVGMALALLALTWFAFSYLVQPPIAASESHITQPPVRHPLSLFRPDHLLDMLLIIIMASPAALLMLPLLFGLRSRFIKELQYCAHPSARAVHQAGDLIQQLHSRLPDVLQRIIRRMAVHFAPDPLYRFLWLVLLGLLGMSFIVKSLIGFPADWDLLTFFQLPLNLLLFQVLSDLRRVPRHARETQTDSASQSEADISHSNEPADKTGIVQSSPATFVRRLWLPLLLIAFCANGAYTGAWLARNASENELSRTNRLQAERNVSDFLTHVQNDPLYAGLDDATRRRLYVKVSLFFVRTYRRLQTTELSEAQRANYLEQMRVGEIAFRKWIQKPIGPDFWREKDRLFNELGAINAAVNR
ncbi:MAG: hypothetical protein KDK34_14235 [Leptospiraceae bacterium]|nr:hypothetical protein [Leptospiraceae bacterium]